MSKKAIDQLRQAFKKADKRFSGTVETSRRPMSEHDQALREAAGKTNKALGKDRHK